MVHLFYNKLHQNEEDLESWEKMLGVSVAPPYNAAEGIGRGFISR